MASRAPGPVPHPPPPSAPCPSETSVHPLPSPRTPAVAVEARGPLGSPFLPRPAPPPPRERTPPDGAITILLPLTKTGEGESLQFDTGSPAGHKQCIPMQPFMRATTLGRAPWGAQNPRRRRAGLRTGRGRDAPFPLEPPRSQRHLFFFFFFWKSVNSKHKQDK